MKTKINYFVLAGFFTVVFLVIQFTEIYGDSAWFKAFLLILIVSYSLGGIKQMSEKRKEELGDDD